MKLITSFVMSPQYCSFPAVIPGWLNWLACYSCFCKCAFSFSINLGFLWVYYSCHPEDPFNYLEAKSIFHLLFSPHCSNHFLWDIIIVYMIPKNSPLRSINKVFSFFYKVLTPLANPLIYSLRNLEVKGALRKVVSILVRPSKNLH